MTHIEDIIDEKIFILNRLYLKEIQQASGLIADTFKSGGRLFVFGNGGSAADAQHMVTEFVGNKGHSFPALAMTVNTSLTTSIANDVNFYSIFSNQVAVLCSKEDTVLGITTSGTSSNVIAGLAKAKELSCNTIALTGASGLQTDGVADVIVPVASSNTQRIQEMHIFIEHTIVDTVRELMR